MNLYTAKIFAGVRDDLHHGSRLQYLPAHLYDTTIPERQPDFTADLRPQQHSEPASNDVRAGEGKPAHDLEAIKEHENDALAVQP